MTPKFLKNPSSLMKALDLMTDLQKKNLEMNESLHKLRRAMGNECVKWLKENNHVSDPVLWLDVADVGIWFLEDKYKGMHGIKDVKTRPGRRPNAPGVRMSIDHKTGKQPDREAWEQLEALRRRIAVVHESMPTGVDALAKAVAS
jgi:hypothetical protein